MRVIGWVCVGTALLFGCGGSSGGGSVAPPGAHALTIHFLGSGTGQVHSSSAFDCSTQCTENVASGSSVTLAATANAGSTFDGWSGACSGTGACTLTMDTDRDVTVTFSKAAAGPALVKLEFAGKGKGRVRSTPAGIDCPGTCAMTVAAGTNVTMTPEADSSSAFIGWGGACSGPGVCSFAATGDQTVWADFEPKTPPGTSCAGIAAPGTPTMLSFVADTPKASFSCAGAVGDAGGTLAFGRHYQDPNVHSDSIDFMRSDGAPLAHAATNQGLFLLQEPVGASAVAGAPYLGPLANRGSQVVNFDAAGKAAGEAFLFGTRPLPAAADPAGGVLVAGDLAASVLDPSTKSLTPAGPVSHAAAMFSGGGTAPALRWGPKALASKGTVFGLGVDLAGRSLIITDGAPAFGAGTISGQWFDRDGKDLTGEFVLISGFTPGASTWFEASPLIGSGLLVRRVDSGTHSQALLIATSGTAAVATAPDWMRARTDTRLQIARGGRAYAVLPLGAKAVTCSQRVEIVAPDGTSCGATDYPIGNGTCDTHDLVLGADGTVLQQLPDSMETKDDTHAFRTCTWRWWPGAAR